MGRRSDSPGPLAIAAEQRCACVLGAGRGIHPYMRVNEYMGQLARVHKALGDETRLRIVNLLGHYGQLCVCDIEQTLRISQSKASRHLGHLKHVGIVEDERDATWIYYRLSSEQQSAAGALTVAVQSALRSDSRARSDIQRARRVCRDVSCKPATKKRNKS